MTFEYTIKSIPTAYAGVNFRSRLEARWAAFFDICGWKWDYEPFDLEGWTPDFLLTAGITDVLVEVKPIHVNGAIPSSTEAFEIFRKAVVHSIEHDVLLLGLAPTTDHPLGPPGWLMPSRAGIDAWLCLAEYLSVHELIIKETGEVFGAEQAWRQAGNAVQWQGQMIDLKHGDFESMSAIVDRAVAKSMAKIGTEA